MEPSTDTVQSDSLDQLDLSCGQIGKQLQSLLRTLGASIVLFLFFCTIYFLVFGVGGAWGLLYILFGTVVPGFLWMRQKKPSVPLMLLISFQTLFIYAIPVLTHNETIEAYSEAEINSACFEIFIFGIAMSLGWLATSRQRDPKAIQVHLFQFTGTNKKQLITRFSLYIFLAAAAYKGFLLTEIGRNAMALVPAEFIPLIRTLTDALISGGSLIGSFCVGCNIYNRNQKLLFWIIFYSTFFIYISAYLLSTATGFISTAILGLFIGKRKLPLGFIALVLIILYLLNLSKFVMRDKYWAADSSITDTELVDVPGRTFEWFTHSVEMLSPDNNDQLEQSKKKQTLANRVVVLGNLLFVQDQVENKKVPVMNGETYLLIPPLLLPRFLWPDKPRTHEGQIRLNVYFGRQTLEASYITYIAWGLLPEAYANFGPFWGAFLFGLFLGLSFGVIESWIRPFPIVSLQSLLVIILVVQVATSFENVASVAVTTLFQTVVVALFGSLPFVEHRKIYVKDTP